MGLPPCVAGSDATEIVVTSMKTRSAQDPTPEGRPARRPAGPTTVTLTGRGGIAVILVVELAARLLATQIGLGPVPGILFVAACVAAAFMTRRSDQLMLVVSPPLIFFLVTLAVEFLKALGESSVLWATLTGLLLALGSDAPWLFLGTALTLGIGMTRGVPVAYNDLRRRLAETAAAPRGKSGSRRGGRRRPAMDEFDEDPVRWDVSP